MSTIPIFTFRVGNDATVVNLHQVLVSHLSKPLDRLINGSMLEASNGVAGFKDTELPTFIDFSHWLYTGNYGTSYTSLLPSDSLSMTGHADMSEKMRPWNYGLTSKERMRKEKHLRLWRVGGPNHSR